MAIRALRSGGILQEEVEMGADENSELDLPCDQLGTIVKFLKIENKTGIRQ
jgi:hypothetical protein